MSAGGLSTVGETAGSLAVSDAWAWADLLAAIRTGLNVGPSPWWLLVAVAAALVSLFVVGVVLVRLPADYFLDGDRISWLSQRPRPLRLLLIAGKNLLGIVLVLMGILLSLPGVPGQGILTVLLGVMLLDIPGRRRLERRIVSQKRILLTINRIRLRYGRPPLLDPRRRAPLGPHRE